MNIRGNCRVLYCLDVAREIDLVRAQEILTTSKRATFQHKSHIPTAEEITPPVRVSWGSSELQIHDWSALKSAEVSLYDFGALCVTWTIPFEGSLEDLVQLSALLYDHKELSSRSRTLAKEILEAVRIALDRPRLSSLIEDYVVYQVEPLQVDPQELLTSSRGTLARVLRAEANELSRQEIDDALANPVSYRPEEIGLIDWLGAFLIGKDTEDERLVLELATVELLELRVLDAQLDLEIHDAYRIMAKRRGLRALAGQRRELERIRNMQADDVILREGIDNSLKLFGDDYLARVYRTAGDRLHFNDWDASIERKLDGLRNVYQGLADQAANRRAEVLEWIIIILIAADIVLYFTPLR